MRHHRVVDEHDADPLTVGQPDRFGVGELLPVERPHEALHVPGQVQLDGTRRLATVRIIERCCADRRTSARAVRCREGRCPDRRIARRHRRLHVDERIASLTLGMRLASPWHAPRAGLAFGVPPPSGGASTSCAPWFAVFAVCVLRSADSARLVRSLPPRRRGGCVRRSTFAACLPPCPMSSIVSTGRGSRSGTGARSPDRMARVPHAMPVRSIACATIV